MLRTVLTELSQKYVVGISFTQKSRVFLAGLTPQLPAQAVRSVWLTIQMPKYWCFKLRLKKEQNQNISPQESRVLDGTDSSSWSRGVVPCRLLCGRWSTLLCKLHHHQHRFHHNTTNNTFLVILISVSRGTPVFSKNEIKNANNGNGTLHHIDLSYCHSTLYYMVLHDIALYCII